MSYSNKDLSVIFYANDFTAWYYGCQDNDNEISKPEYFGSVSTLMNVGDMIIMNSADGFSIRYVTKTDTGVVETKIYMVNR